MKTLATCPDVRIDLLPAWNAWVECHNRRQSGFDANPLSISAITGWLDMRGFTDEEAREMMYEFIVFIDDLWLEMYYDDQKQKSEGKK